MRTGREPTTIAACQTALSEWNDGTGLEDDGLILVGDRTGSGLSNDGTLVDATALMIAE